MISLNFCCSTWMARSEFGLNDIKAWIPPALYLQFRLLVVYCGGIYDFAHSEHFILCECIGCPEANNVFL